MLSLQKVVVLSTLLLSALATPTHHHSHDDDDDATNWAKFSALLDTVDESALHRVLHAVYPKFKDGVFSKDRTAAEQVHSENPIMASKLVHIAKRQGSNETFPIPSTTTTPTVIVSTTTSSRSISQAPSPSSPQQSSELAASSSRQQEISSAINSAIDSLITATSVPTRTSVLVPPSTPESATPISTNSGAVVYSSAGGGVVTLSSSAVDIRFEPSTSTRLYYTTLPDGNVETLTDVVTVNAAVTETADPNAQASESAGLQGAAVKIAAGNMALLLMSGLAFVVAAVL